MRNGISAGPIDQSLFCAPEITRACAVPPTFSPVLAYAIRLCETGGVPDAQACTVVSDDGGHGLFQLTSSFPAGWADPYTNASFAVAMFLLPAEQYWAQDEHLQGDDLVRAIAAEFNAGRGGAMSGHAEGDVGKFTTFGEIEGQTGMFSYSDRALHFYKALKP